MLVLTPFGGICNRLLALHSAIHLSIHFRHPLRVIWRVDRKLGCEYQQLFEVPEEIGSLHNVKRYNRSWTNKLREFAFRAAHWPPTYARIHQSEIDAMFLGHFDFSSLRSFRHIYIEACQAFYQKEATFYKFRPIQSLSKRIDDVTKEFQNTVGVHIRRNVGSTKFSPTILFEREIANILENDPETTFFLATDDPREEETIRAAFPNKIICSEKRSLDRGNPEAIEDAVVDLYALAATKWILGSSVSTYSICAGRIGQKSVKLMLAENESQNSFLYHKVEEHALLNSYN